MTLDELLNQLKHLGITMSWDVPNERVVFSSSPPSHFTKEIIKHGHAIRQLIHDSHYANTPQRALSASGILPVPLMPQGDQ